MKMICSQCSTELRPFKNGVTVIETAGKELRPYKIWQADLWECRVCGIKVVAGFGRAFIAINPAPEVLQREIEAAEVVIYNHEYPQEALMNQDLDDPGMCLIKGAHDGIGEFATGKEAA